MFGSYLRPLPPILNLAVTYYTFFQLLVIWEAALLNCFLCLTNAVVAWYEEVVASMQNFFRWAAELSICASEEDHIVVWWQATTTDIDWNPTTWYYTENEYVHQKTQEWYLIEEVSCTQYEHSEQGISQGSRCASTSPSSSFIIIIDDCNAQS